MKGIKLSAWRIALYSLIGDVAMWYDYALYAELLEVWKAQFFSETLDEWASLIGVFAIFASGFMMRIVGSIVLGSFGDRFGRKHALLVSVCLLAISSMVIAILPPYQMVGIWAPIFLTIARLFQGFALGGESGNAVFLGEYSPKNRRSFLSGLQVLSAVLGMLFSNLVVIAMISFMGEDSFMQWGWRFAFILGALISFAGLIIRRQMPDSVVELGTYGNDKSSFIAPLATLWRNYKQNLFVSIGVDSIEEVTLYTFVVFLGVLMSDFAQIKPFMIGLLIVFMLIIAFLADYINRIRLMLLGSLMLLFFAFPIVWYVSDSQGYDIMYRTVAISVFVLVVALTLAPVNVVMLDLFPGNVRYTGFALSRNISAGLFGGLAPILLTKLVLVTGSEMSVAFYLMCSGILALGSLFFARRLSVKE